MYQLYSTCLASVIKAIMIGFWFCYVFFVYRSMGWDLFIIILAMALSKIAAMIYFRIAN